MYAYQIEKETGVPKKGERAGAKSSRSPRAVVGSNTTSRARKAMGLKAAIFSFSQMVRKEGDCEEDVKWSRWIYLFIHKHEISRMIINLVMDQQQRFDWQKLLRVSVDEKNSLFLENNFIGLIFDVLQIEHVNVANVMDFFSPLSRSVYLYIFNTFHSYKHKLTNFPSQIFLFNISIASILRITNQRNVPSWGWCKRESFPFYQLVKGRMDNFAL